MLPLGSLTHEERRLGRLRAKGLLARANMRVYDPRPRDWGQIPVIILDVKCIENTLYNTAETLIVAAELTRVVFETASCASLEYETASRASLSSPHFREVRVCFMPANKTPAQCFGRDFWNPLLGEYLPFASVYVTNGVFASRPEIAFYHYSMHRVWSWPFRRAVRAAFHVEGQRRSFERRVALGWAKRSALVAMSSHGKLPVELLTLIIQFTFHHVPEWYLLALLSALEPVVP